MILIYTPADGDVQRYVFNPNKVSNFEAEAIEKQTGWTWSEFGERLERNSALAMRALLWTLQRRQHPTLKFGDVAFTLDQLQAEAEPEELIAVRDALLADTRLDDDERASRLAVIEAEMAKAGVDVGEPAPKARASKGA